MTVEVKINGQLIHTIEVVNCGPVSEYEDGDYPGGGGARKYRWTVDRHTSGDTMHFRDDGALNLASIVCSEAASHVATPCYERR